MLEKGGEYVVGIFPDGLVLSSNLLKLHCVINIFGKTSFENSSVTHISRSHTVHNKEIRGICKRYVGG